LTAWQLEKVFSENDLKVLERRFHDALSSVPEKFTAKEVEVQKQAIPSLCNGFQ
jgi:hypothetical protein